MKSLIEIPKKLYYSQGLELLGTISTNFQLAHISVVQNVDDFYYVQYPVLLKQAPHQARAVLGSHVLRDGKRNTSFSIVVHPDYASSAYVKYSVEAEVWVDGKCEKFSKNIELIKISIPRQINIQGQTIPTVVDLKTKYKVIEYEKIRVEGNKDKISITNKKSISFNSVNISKTHKLKVKIDGKYYLTPVTIVQDSQSMIPCPEYVSPPSYTSNR
ncbi:hypothetical protein CLIB1444_03S09406 [[Candida] jaroonii]|uniref:Uncharacterized protein n=1 Tax=[Candida] jaroonii TaxID=467808 RepID=A0ACA9Y5V0_9ASCO|nr:hypothetical protein CLIB1444_03S09406 [[Candida] jaroonii]